MFHLGDETNRIMMSYRALYKTSPSGLIATRLLGMGTVWNLASLMFKKNVSGIQTALANSPVKFIGVPEECCSR